MIVNKYNRVNRDISFIDNEFRNNILKSFSEIYSIKKPDELFDKIFINIEKEKIITEANRIKEEYIKILDNLNILKDIKKMNMKIIFRNLSLIYIQ